MRSCWSPRASSTPVCWHASSSACTRCARSCCPNRCRVICKHTYIGHVSNVCVRGMVSFRWSMLILIASLFGGDVYVQIKYRSTILLLFVLCYYHYGTSFTHMQYCFVSQWQRYCLHWLLSTFLCLPSASQDHYDWGLRAIKSVLVVAGSLKREERSRPEEQVLTRHWGYTRLATTDFQ